MNYKDLAIDAVKDVDVKTGVITGYFSIFGNVDSDGDIVMPGAFKKSIKENGPDSEHPRILHLYQHDPYQVLGKPSVLKEDKKGLYFESKIAETTLGKDVLQLYRDKILTEHSIGFNIVKREVDEAKEIQKLTELKLWEGSTVSWGANMEALVGEVKAEGLDCQMWNKILKKFDALNTAIKGTYTDDTARQLEIHFNQLKDLIFSLITKVEPVKSTPEVKEPNVSELIDIINKLKK